MCTIVLLFKKTSHIRTTKMPQNVNLSVFFQKLEINYFNRKQQRQDMPLFKDNIGNPAGEKEKILHFNKEMTGW